MGVLVKGMKMPVSCLTCPHHEHGTIHEWELYCGLTGDYIGHWDDESFNNGYRPDTCPLVEVPTPHGRLIDADALKVSLAFAEKTAEWAVPALRAVLMVIDEMLTIIEAEEGELNG
jgi:hypothetical protein